MAGIIFSRIISTSMVTRNELLAKEKQERLQQKKEARIRKQADKEEKEREALRLLKIQEDAEKKAREKYRSAALDAGAPARAAKAKRLADEAEERNRAAKIVEDARLAKEAELEKERIDTEMMEEEDRLVPSSKSIPKTCVVLMKDHICGTSQKGSIAQIKSINVVPQAKPVLPEACYVPCFF